MATLEYWIQLENRRWDLCPHNIDRMTGQNIVTLDPTATPVHNVTLTSTSTGFTRIVPTMFKPIRKGTQLVDALIYRRYRPPADLVNFSDAWTVPDDRKVNPWDLNELDPGEHGTMGTIPGPVIEGSFGGDIINIHFRNKDHRPMAIEHCCHSIHPHGVVFKPASDGAYPLSPPDAAQPVAGSPGPDETALWAGVPGFTGPFKKGDRVPPDGTFKYTWNTFGWGSTAGVWLYHDHSICDMDNVELGAIGIIVIHNPSDTDDVDIRDSNDPTMFDITQLPGGSPTGSPVFRQFFPFDPTERVALLPHQLESLVPHSAVPHVHSPTPTTPAAPGARATTPAATPSPPAAPAAPSFIFQQDDLLFQVSPALDLVISWGIQRYRMPPTKLLVLQLFHQLGDVFSCINGRQYLGNTPTIVSGRSTLMRFGVVGMGSEFHTFHLHGHRWVIPGADGNTPGAIQSSIQKTAVSQFEDTRTFGPANSFVFTINGASGSFMRAGGPGTDDSLGEWHMHCHVLMHMMMGMMGSLLIIKGGEIATTLPRGKPCPSDAIVAGTHTVMVNDFAFAPATVNVNSGDTVTWMWMGNNHSVTADDGSFDSGVHNSGFTFNQMFMQSSGTNIPYYCSIHGGAGGTGMSGAVHIN
jgi:FtsP/CotA-like multicopper oxidase with cupredoxin domain/plastocyanin